jgi:hypothetical protein
MLPAHFSRAATRFHLFERFDELRFRVTAFAHLLPLSFVPDPIPIRPIQGVTS